MPRIDRRTYRSSTHTRVLASFHTFQDNGISIDEPILSHPKLGKIVGFTSNKSFGPASGQFTITFKKPETFGPRSALRIWKEPEGVWVRIKIQTDGQVFDTVLGIIDTVEDSTDRSGLSQ